MALVRDITERKRAEHELRASEQRFRTVVQFSFDLYSWETDAQHRFTRQELAEGLAGAEQPFTEIGKTRWEMPYLEPDADAWRKHRETLDAHQPFRDFEIVRPTPDGGKRYLSVSGMPMFDEFGTFHRLSRRGQKPHRAQEGGREVAAQRSLSCRSGKAEFERRLCVQRKRNELSIGRKDFIDSGGSIRWRVPPSREAWLQRVHPEDRIRAYDELQEALRQKREYAIEYRLALPDGTLKYIRSIGHPRYSADGELVEVVGTTTDVTERVTSATGA